MPKPNSIWDYRNPYEWMTKVRKSDLPPLIICCAITGGIQGKEVNPNLPETPEEQAVQAHDAYNAGASMVHVHVRDPNRLYDCSCDPARYRLVNGMIREKCPDIIINNTTGGGIGNTLEERMCALDARPEVASLNMGPDAYKITLKARTAPVPHPRPEATFQGCMPVDYREITRFAEKMKSEGIKPELEIYHPGMFWTFEDILSQGLVASPFYFQFVMGYQTSLYPTPANLLTMVNNLPSNSVFAVAGIGPFQLPMITMSIILGGHVRVGMEDNVYSRRGELYASNAEAVERIVRIAKELNREIATPAEARAILGLSEKPSSY